MRLSLYAEFSSSSPDLLKIKSKRLKYIREGETKTSSGSGLNKDVYLKQKKTSECRYPNNFVLVNPVHHLVFTTSLRAN